MLLDFDPDVTAVSSQPFWLHWRDDDGRARRHAPDFFVRRADGSALVVDVRPDDRIEPRDVQAFDATARMCELAGWRVHPGRRGRPGAGGECALAVAVPASAERARRRRRLPRSPDGVFGGGRALFEGAERAGDRLAVLPVVYHLLWKGGLSAELSGRPLGPWVAGEGGGTVMSARPGRLGIGDRVGVRGAPYVVVGVSGTRVRLAGGDGTVLSVTVTDILADPRYELAGAGISSAAPAVARPLQIGVEGLPAVEQARWWEGHIAEVVYGLPPEAPGVWPKPQYDPALHSLSARERTKVAELAAAGHQVPLSTFKHRRQCWEARGLAGLADHRVDQARRSGGPRRSGGGRRDAAGDRGGRRRLLQDRGV